MLGLLSETVELAADRTGELARLCAQPRGSLFLTVFRRVALKLVDLLWKVSSILVSSLELYLLLRSLAVF